MPRKIKHVKKVEEIKEEKPQAVLKTEVVEEKPIEEATPVSAVSQLASVVEPKPVEVAVTPVAAAVVEPVKEAEAPSTVTPAVTVESPVVVEEQKKKKKNYLWPVWILLAFILGAGAGFGLSKFNFDRKPVVTLPVNNTNKTVTPTVVPSKAPEAVFDRAKIKLKVLNGSGVRGKAGVAKVYFESLGYKDVVADNADNDNYVKTQLSIKDSLKNFTANIKSDASGKYDLETKISTLASDDAVDVLIIIGQK